VVTLGLALIGAHLLDVLGPKREAP
jgi:hypothetical protein